MIEAMSLAGAHERKIILGWSALMMSAPLSCAGDSDGRDEPTTTVAATGSGTAGDDDSAGPGTTDGPTSTSNGPGSSPTTDPTDSADSTDTGSDTGIPPNCGDGVQDDDEACDDANAVDADGCNIDCTVSGSILWSHSQAGGLATQEDGYGVAVASDGAAFVAGNLTVVSSDWFVRGYDPEGGLDWSVTVDGTSAAADVALGIVQHGDQLYVTGQRTMGVAAGDVFVANYGLDGSAGWTDAYNDPIDGGDAGRAIATDVTGNVGVAGEAVADLQGANVFVRVYNPAGGILWTQTYTSAGAAADRAYAIAADVDGNFIVAGYETVGGQRDVWLRKFDPAGTPLWTQGYAGAEGLDDTAYALAVDQNGDIVVAGYESTAAIPTLAWLRRLDLNGNELWTDTYAGSAAEGAQALGVTIDAAGDITYVGFETVGGLGRMLIRKYSSVGTVKWTETIEGAEATSSYGRGITVGPDQHLWIAGGIDKGVDLRDVYIAKIAR
jgi:cysteine-rich repeat protein